MRGEQDTQARAGASGWMGAWLWCCLHRGSSVYAKSHIWISSTVPHSAPLLRVNICEGALLRANLFGKMFLGHIIFIREGVSWTKVSYWETWSPGRLKPIQLNREMSTEAQMKDLIIDTHETGLKNWGTVCVYTVLVCSRIQVLKFKCHYSLKKMTWHFPFAGAPGVRPFNIKKTMSGIF